MDAIKTAEVLKMNCNVFGCVVGIGSDRGVARCRVEFGREKILLVARMSALTHKYTSLNTQKSVVGPSLSRKFTLCNKYE
jgi:hypothetical protein